MKKNIFFLAILMFVGAMLFTSCEKEEELSSKKEILSFVFEASKNATLEHNVLSSINGTDIVAEVPFGTNTQNLIPSVEISAKAGIGPVAGVSTDFSGPVNYTITAEDGSTKTFTVNVPISPAPYIGKWETETSINIENLGLSQVIISVNDSGDLVMELKSTITGNLWGQSIKGHFDPKSVCNTEICLNQTHRWLDNQWTAETSDHSIMYTCEGNQMEFKYCLRFPKDQWWFTVSLVKIE